MTLHLAAGRALLLSLGLAILAAALPAATEAQILPGAAEPAEPALTAEAVDRLLEVLRDDAARALLIERLEAATAEDAAAEAPAEAPNIAQTIAAATAASVQKLVADLGRAGTELARLGTLAERIGQGDTEALRRDALPLALTILTTVAIFLALVGLADRFAARRAPLPTAGFGPRLRATLLSFLARLGALVVAWAAGYALAALVFTAPEEGISRPQSLYLNAFAVFGLFRIVLRTVASPDADHEPVMSRLAPGAQAVIYRRLRTIGGVTIQGYLFLLPLTQIWAGFAAARPLRTLLATLLAVLALLAIRRIRRVLELARHDRPGPAQGLGQAGRAMAEGAQSVWRRAWPILATLYVLYGWIVAMTRPARTAEVVIGGTVHTAVALALLLGALRLLRAAPSLKMPLPAFLLSAVPRLGPRADLIAAAAGWVLAAVLVVVALAIALSGWTAFDISDTLATPAVQVVLWRLLSALIVAFAAAALWAGVASWIDHRLTQATGNGSSARSRTLLALFRNAFTVAIAVLAAMVTLSQLGIDIAPLLAGAGVIGLAVGFGSQKLVQDIITGIFIQLENAINEGDVVGVAGITGGVEKVTIRSVRLRTLDGAAHIVPFSSVDTVTNLTRDFSYHLAEIGVAYKEKVPTVKAAMFEAFDRLVAEGFGPEILEPLEMQGVIALGDSSVVVRARIKTLPGKQWATGRRFTELVKEVFDERGIEIPFPHRQLVFPPSLPPMPANGGGTLPQSA